MELIPLISQVKHNYELYNSGEGKQAAIFITSTGKSIVRDHCHERPPVLKNHIFLVEGSTF